MISPRSYAGLLVLVALAGLPGLGFGLLEWDDPVYVTRNPLVLAPGAASLRDHLLTPQLGYPVPLTILSYRLEHALVGFAPWLYHFDNLVLHALAVVLAFRLAARLGLGLAGASLAALVFGLHPANAEVVSWATGRKDLLAAVFAFAALLRASSRAPYARATSVACYALALLSKPVVALLFLLVPLLPQRERPAGELGAREQIVPALRLLLPYALVLAPIAVLDVLGHRASGALNEGGFAGISRVRAALYALGHHTRLFALLEEPTAKYLPEPWPPRFPSAPELAALALCLALAFVSRVLDPERRRIARFGVLFALLAYLPSSSLLVPIARFLADSYLYLPSFGLALVLGALLEQILTRVREGLGRVLRALPWLLGAALVPAFWLSASRFESDLALWSHARRRFPHHARVCREWSNAVAGQFGSSAGLAAIDRCIAEFGDALFVKNRGILLARLGRRDEAIAWLERAQKNAPGDAVIARYLGVLRANPLP